MFKSMKLCTLLAFALVTVAAGETPGLRASSASSSYSSDSLDELTEALTPQQRAMRRECISNCMAGGKTRAQCRLGCVDGEGHHAVGPGHHQTTPPPAHCRAYLFCMHHCELDGQNEANCEVNCAAVPCDGSMVQLVDEQS